MFLTPLLTEMKPVRYTLWETAQTRAEGKQQQIGDQLPQV
jgi:hypothetical protein